VRVLESLSCNKHIVAFPEATVGLEDEPLAAITVVNTAEGFVEALKSQVREATRRSETYRAHTSAQVAAARDAALYALGKKTARKKVRKDRHALFSVLK
jgi:hypothetical protein